MQGVTVDFNANLTRFTNAVDKATSDLNRFQTNSSRISAQVNRTFAGLGVGLSAGVFAGFIKQSIDAADALNDLSKTTGASVETLAGLQLAAKQSGTELETVARGMLKFSGVVLDASNGSKEAADKISALGLNLKNLQTQSPEQQFIALAGALEKFGADKQGVIVADVLGQKMATLTPLLSEGAKGLGEMLEAGKKLNPINTEMAKQADKFNDSMAVMEARSSRLGISMANSMLPAMNDIIDAMQRAQNESGTLAALLIGLGGGVVAAFGGETNQLKRLDAQINDLSKTLQSQLIGLNAKNREGSGIGFVDDWLWGTTGDVEKTKEQLKSLIAMRDQLSHSAAETNANTNKPKTIIDEYKKPGDSKKAKKIDQSSVDDYEFRIKSKVAKLFDDSDLSKAKEYEDTLAYLDHLYFDLGISAEYYDSAKEKLNKTTSNAVDIIKEENARLDDLVAGADFTKLKKDQEDMAFLALAFTDGIKQADGSMRKLSEAEYLDAVSHRLGLVGDKTEEVSDFARDMGLSFTSAFEDAMLESKNFSDVLKALDKDIARIILRKGITEPVGNAVSSAVTHSGMGDWFKNLLPSFDVGTDFVPHDMIAQIHKGERIVPAAQNKPGMGGVVYNFGGIDMRGASVEAVQRLEQFVMGLNGSIERRALGAVLQARTRGAF